MSRPTGVVPTRLPRRSTLGPLPLISAPALPSRPPSKPEGCRDEVNARPYALTRGLAGEGRLVGPEGDHGGGVQVRAPNVRHVVLRPVAGGDAAEVHFTSGGPCPTSGLRTLTRAGALSPPDEQAPSDHAHDQRQRQTRRPRPPALELVAGMDEPETVRVFRSDRRFERLPHVLAGLTPRRDRSERAAAARSPWPTLAETAAVVRSASGRVVRRPGS